VYTGEGAPIPPPETGLERVTFPSPVGNLAAYRTVDPKDGRKHPAVVWAHGGFGGIDNWFWVDRTAQNDQSAAAFREAGIVEVIPSWRGENNNPGEPEIYLGEVDDLLAARDYTAKLPWVDPERIYLVGHSSGGTLVLLASAQDARFRAAISFGGNPWVEAASNLPTRFDPADAQEWNLRRFTTYVGSVKVPTFRIEALAMGPGIDQETRRLADAAHAPYTAVGVLRADHFNLLRPLTVALAKRILVDTDLSQPFAWTADEIQTTFDTFWGTSATVPRSAAFFAPNH
jgi:pimeloyl-ACP methyl ester carboxylesterase